MDDDNDHMLTTVDNPWNPFTNYDEWYEFDQDAGYNTPGLLARVANATTDLSDSDYDREIENAITEIVVQNVSGMHVRASRPQIAA